MRPGLRVRVALVVVVAVLAAALGITIAVYRLQANETTRRFTAAARVSTTSDAIQASEWVFLRVQQSVPRLNLVFEYLQGRNGMSWCVIDFTRGSPPPERTPDGRYPCQPYNARQGRDAGLRVNLPAELVDLPRRFVWTSSDSFVPNPSTVVDATGKRSLAVNAPIYIDGWKNRGEYPPFVVVELYSLGPLEAELAKLQRDLLWITGAVVVLTAGAALLATRLVQAPVRRLAKAAERLGTGELDVRVPVRGRDDLAKLTTSFNTMASRLGDAIEQQRRFVEDVAHDLRTPLAAMVAAAETVERGDPDTGPRAAQLLGDQTRRLARLVTDLLEMSRFDAGAAELRPEPVDLAELWTSEVQPRVAGDPVVTGDLARLHTITRNLLTNAVRHGAEPITVTIDGTRPDEVVVRVADAGPGVPEELLPLVFDRFTRGDKARGATEGSGLGLAIAKENTELHGGKLTVHNNGGAVFTLTLPRTAPTDHD